MARRILALILLASCGLLVGCGLEEYENRMVQAQGRVKRYDDMNAVLDEPLEMPSHQYIEKQGDKQITRDGPWEVFLRAPLGLKTKWEGEPREGVFYHYPRGKKQSGGLGGAAPPPPPPGGGGGAAAAPAVSAPGGPAATRNVTDLYLAFSSDAKDIAAFAADVLRFFPTAPNPPTLAQRNMQIPDRGAFRAELVEFDDDNGSYAAYFHKPSGGQTTVAAIFRCEKGKRESSRGLLEMSIGTLGVDKEMAAVKQLFGRRIAKGGGGSGVIAPPPPPPPPPGMAPKAPGS